MTKGGIYLNLDESNYKIKKFGLIFYFSSKFYMEKFKNNVEKYVELENIKLANKTKLVVNFNKLFAISYYKKIEKRGFKIKDINQNNEIKTYTIYNEKILL